MTDLYLSGEHVIISSADFKKNSNTMYNFQISREEKMKLTKNIQKKVRKEKIRPSHMNRTFSWRMEGQ